MSCHKVVPPTWTGELYAGDSSKSSIVRAQSNEEVSCSDSNFDNYVCMSYDDYKSFIRTFVDGCKVWDKDVAVYRKKLDECGLLTYKNMKRVQDCLEE